jgi:FKBP-type peptidyl-prolyl cis-trans isomerase 2
MSIKNGDYVKVQYTGTFDDGTVFDSSEKNNGEPLIFKVGAGEIIPGFDKAVEGMKNGEEKQIHIEAVDAYGEVQPDMIKTVPRKNFPDEKIAPNMNVVLGTPDGYQFQAKILKVSDEEVKFDLNHPLAGKALNFKIKVMEISETPPDGYQTGCGCGCGGDCNDDCSGGCDDGCEDHQHKE